MYTQDRKIKNGDMIYGYTVLAVANGVVMAHSDAAPDPYVVWRLDADGCGVWGGAYTQTSEDAEWDFCAKAFAWFEDNVNINMIEDDDLKDPAGFIRSARMAVSDATKLVDELIDEMDSEKNAPQEEIAEQDNIEKMLNYLEDFDFEKLVEIQSSVSSWLSKKRSSSS